MATAVSSPWAKPGAWALDSEQHEDELNHQHHLDLAAAATATPPSDFPSLSVAVTAKPKKKSKQVLSLAEFSSYKPPSQTAAATLDVVLPTGPRERTAEEIAESRRGGFRNYGGDRERTRVSRDDGESMGPSRADEADDWSKTKRVSSFGSGSDRDRDVMGPSRADGVDDWSKGKKLSSFGERERERDMGPSRVDGIDDWSKGKKFGEERGERREKMGFFNSSRADDSDKWASKKGFGSGFGPVRERRVGFEATGPGSDVDNWVKGKESNVTSNGGGGGRPRLNLQPRTLPVEKEVEKEDVGSVKGKGNPFGAARPREEVLKEKGQDWKEIDEKLESVKIKEVERSSGSSFDSIGRRRGITAAPVVAGGDDNNNNNNNKSVRGWRKPDSPVSYAAAAAAPPPTPPSAETIEKSADPETIEKAPEAN